MTDEAGCFLRGDLVGALTAASLGADTIVTPVTSNSALEKLGLFERVLRTRVGSPHVISGMTEAKAAGARIVVGFEANGGALLGSDIVRGARSLLALPTRDAMLPILAVLSLHARRKKQVSTIAAGFNFQVALSDRVQDVEREWTQAMIAKLDSNDIWRDAVFAEHGGVLACDRRDGLRLALGDGATIHFRASGNAPELRIYVEAADRAKAEALLADELSFASKEKQTRYCE